jgi:hypothetical protein
MKKRICIVAGANPESARKLGARILTGDPHFQGIKEATLVIKKPVS